MKGTLPKIVVLMVGGHLLLSLVLVAIDATVGIDDQGASFAVAFVFYCLNLPVIWLLRLGSSAAPPIAVVALIGIAQWTAVAVVVRSLWQFMSCRRSARKLTKTI